LGSLFGLSAILKSGKAEQTVVRVFLLASLETVRLENTAGNYVDVPI
jgi:hypothetical protein